MSLPIGPQTFKRNFLNGNGSIEFKTGSPGGPSLDLTRPIPARADKIFTVKTGGGTSTLEFGESNGLSVGVSFDASIRNGIHVIRSAAESEFLTSRGLDEIVQEGKLGIHLLFDATAGAKVAGNLPAGPAAFHFGVEAGGGVGYDRFIVVDSGETAGAIVRSLLADVRLPQHSGALANVPAPGEILAFRYSGFLDLSAGLNWGYQINGVESFEFHGLEAALEYDLRLKAGVSVGYSLAGDFEIETRRGEAPNLVRLIVRKSRDRKFSFAAGFQADAGYELRGLPGTANEWLITFIGADTKTALTVFSEVRDLSDLDELEKRVGKLLMPSVRRLAHKWLDEALDNQTVAEFLAKVGQVVTAYQNADRTVVSKVMDLYEDYLVQGKLDELRGTLVTIRDLNSRSALSRLPGDDKAWDVVDRLAGGDLFSLLERNDIFAEVREVATKGVDFIDGAWQQELCDLVDELKSSLKLDDMFGQLAKFASKQKLKSLADEQLQGLVERLLGKTFEEIRGGSVGKSAQELKKILDGINDFKLKFETKLRQAFEQSVSLSINYAYSRSSSRKALLDIEFDVSDKRGGDLFREAAHGRFREVFAKANLEFVRVHEGQLTHTLTKSSQLQINVFGWSLKRLVEVVSDTDHSLEVKDGGLVQIFTTKTMIKRRIEKNGEILESNFLFQMLGESLRGNLALTPETVAKRRYFVKSLEKMSVQYDFMQLDQVTDSRELTQYLQLAELLGLVPSAQAVSEQVTREFTGRGGKVNLGKVQARYVVRYAPDSVRAVFLRFSDTKQNKQLTDLVRTTCRQIMASRYINKNRTAWNALAGFAYLDPENAKIHDKGFTAFLNSKRKVVLPAWFTGKSAGRKTLPSAQREIVNTLFNIEKSLAERVIKLDNVIDDALAGRKGVSGRDLEDAARGFVEKGGIVDAFGPTNAFFGVFDRLIYLAEGNKGQRESSMILEITPPAGQTVRKFFMSGSPEDASAESPALMGSEARATAVRGKRRRSRR